jgi:hypothetical protein
MPKHVPKLLVIDMLECLEKKLDFAAGMTYEVFLADSKTQDAVIRNNIDHSIIRRIITVHSTSLKISLEKILKTL